MSVPSVETAKGRQRLRVAMDKAGEMGWTAVRLDQALDALDARDAALAKVRATERERCAKVAAQLDCGLPGISDEGTPSEMARRIAAAIRALRDPGS